MKKLFFILICFSVVFILSCGGGSGSSGDACESNLDCKVGYVCSGGSCVSESSSEDGSGDGDSSELPDDNNGSEDGKSDNDGNSSTDDSDDWVSPDDPSSNGTCEPGKKQKCGYQGPEGTEDVGPCKAAVRTCKEDGTWGKCEGAVEPVYESGEELCTNDIDDDCDGEVDNKTGSCIVYWHDDTDPTENPDSDSVIDVGYTGNYSDAYQLPSDIDTGNICNDTCIPMKADCLPVDIDEGESGLCNGLDDDCDGTVDEGCSCSPGQTQACFLGPKNFRGKGTCADGTQTCKVTMRGTKSVGVWGECVGGISPKQDVCDNADNNCNGCDDDKLCCAPPIDCSYDLTEDGPFQPFTFKIIDGKKIYDKELKFNDADTATWEWSLSQGPCDIVLGNVNSYIKAAKTQGELGDFAESDRKTVVSGVGLSQFKVKFRLSGNYLLKLKITRPNGEVHECEWVIKVVSDGLRIELCWDMTGSHDSPTSGRDLDLHMGKDGKTSSWTSGACYFSSKNPSWGYSDTQNYDKEGNLKTMKNPRLDMDNIRDAGEPENINVDNPNNGDIFRVGVNYFSWYDYDPSSLETHPVINVYCGGTLKATYGVEPQVTNFKNKNNFWEVVEVTWVGDYSSDACELNLKWNDGYIINSSMPSYTDW
ncbi:hypothetical protein IKO70_06795 [bacterium]|nr:hypothetical protein [bacterium]